MSILSGQKVATTTLRTEKYSEARQMWPSGGAKCAEVLYTNIHEDCFSTYRPIYTNSL
jgi:hypothetical protein